MEFIFIALVIFVAALIVFLDGRAAKSQMARERLDADFQKWRSNAKPKVYPFDAKDLARRTTLAFEKVQDAKSSGRLESVAGFLSEGAFEQMQIVLDISKRLAHAPRYRCLSVLESDLVEHETRGAHDVVVMRIKARFQTQGTDSRLISNHTIDSIEYWTLVRSKGSSNDATSTRRCPACGARADRVQINRCPACGVTSVAAVHEWVVSEMAHRCSTFAKSGSLLQALDDLRKRDATFSARNIEGVAAAIFWRIRAAETLQDIRYLATHMPTPPHAIPNHRFADIAVDMASVTDISQETHDGELHDQLTIEIAWRGTHQDLSGVTDAILQDEWQIDGDYWGRHVTSLCLIRGQLAKSIEGHGLMALLCHHCNGSLAGQFAAHCQHCGVIAADSRSTWVLKSWQERENF